MKTNKYLENWWIIIFIRMLWRVLWIIHLRSATMVQRMVSIQQYLLWRLWIKIFQFTTTMCVKLRNSGFAIILFLQCVNRVPFKQPQVSHRLFALYINNPIFTRTLLSKWKSVYEWFCRAFWSPRTWRDQNYFVSFHLLTIFRSKGHISKVFSFLSSPNVELMFHWR